MLITLTLAAALSTFPTMRVIDWGVYDLSHVNGGRYVEYVTLADGSRRLNAVLLRVRLPARPAGDYRPRRVCVAWGGPFVGSLGQTDGSFNCFPEEWVSEQEKVGELLGSPITMPTGWAYVVLPVTGQKRTTFGTAPDMQVRMWWMWAGQDADGQWIGDPIGGPVEESRVILKTTLVYNLPEYWRNE